jgi:hypothetical protein
MSGEKWAPGTVAWVEGVSLIGSDRAGPASFNGGPSYTGWRSLDNQWSIKRPTIIRPLLVLDPDDETQVAEFWTALVEASCFHASEMTHVVRAMLPKPLISKPPEPMGFCAAVSISDGTELDGRWGRGSNQTPDARDWGHESLVAGLRRWSDFPDTVTVLSEGVS